MTHPAPKLELYRVVLGAENTVNQLLRTDKVMRPPLKVPYVVDNLWEWVRAGEYPSRRFSAFASPKIHLAETQGAKDGKVYRVEFPGDHRICQLKGYRDAKYHPDCISLPILLLESLGDEWIRSEIETKSEAGRLWLPTLSKAEVNSLFEEVSTLSAIRDSVRESIRFWEDVELIPENGSIVDEEGELFFEASDGYYLRPAPQD